MAIHLVTGATGFVGGALVLELLDRTNDEIIGLTRPAGGDANARLMASLRTAAEAYGRAPEDLPLHRVRAVAGDVTLPECGVDGALRAHVLWHAAASLRYEDRYADEIRSTNVDGTRQALALARRAGVEVVNQISTAYVSGSRQGRIHEEHYDDAGAQNHYERSKVAAEDLVRNASGMLARILRPSIVVGHSRTLGATTFTGLYGFTRQFLQYRGVLERVQAGMYATRRMRLRVSADAPIDFIAVDAVAAQAVAIGLSDAPSGVYHLTQGEGCPPIGDSIRIVAKELGFAEPEFAAPDEPLDWLDEQLDKRLDFYGSYVRGHRIFDRSRAESALGNRPELRRPLPPVGELAAWYIRRLEDERRQMPVVR
ncbi:MAG TPA: SDR family oxidoreductase [Labilithrix sp.]|nr:SDR family oxidoreductase [Labilithrix sp.]